MGQCKLCNTTSNYISKEINVCLKCIRERPEDALPLAMQAHRRSRSAFGLPECPPKDSQGVACNICVNECRIPENGTGYCGLRKNEGGRLIGVSPEQGKLSWYYDPLPTNCVGDWVCPGGTGAGYPKYAYSPGPESGSKNLAVFFHACSFNCLYCQNWHFRRETIRSHTTSVNNLVSDVDEKTSCICYFGGDPTPQLPFSLRASRLTLEKNKGRILRICWETNGSMHKGLLDKMIKLSLNSGGCIKFDLKAWDENLHIALTGITNKRTIENFLRAGEKINLRAVPPLVIANTLLVPGYIDEDEIRSIAKFIASINPDIPYSLLAYYPHFYMSDIPSTTRILAERCLKVAKEEGLKNVRIGNIHLLV
ncbi:MAG: radical SAM protein [Nitrospirota bacterium]|nr:radical SAM protein [Nitrospirota bacterium]